MSETICAIVARQGEVALLERAVKHRKIVGHHERPSVLTE